MCNGGMVLKYLINFLKYISYIIVIIFVFIIGYDILHQCLIYEVVYIPLFVLWMVTYTSQFLLQEKIRKQTMTEEKIILFKKKRAEDIHWLRAREDFYKSLGLITIGWKIWTIISIINIRGWRSQSYLNKIEELFDLYGDINWWKTREK